MSIEKLSIINWNHSQVEVRVRHIKIKCHGLNMLTKHVLAPNCLDSC